MQGNSEEERRQKLRVDFKTQITLRIGGSEVHVDGDSRDLSLSGIFINTDEEAQVGTKCDVEVCLTGMAKPLNLKMNGSIIRKETSGIAIAFESMDLDSYTHLKNIVRYNTSNPDDIH